MSQRKKLHEQQSLGERLRWLRLRNGLSLRAFGDAISYDKSYLSRLERGESANPSEELLAKIAQAFQINLPWLEHGEGDPGVAQATKHVASPLSSKPAIDEVIETELQCVEIVRLLMDGLSAREMLQKTLRMLNDQSIPIIARRFWSAVFLRALFNAGDEEPMALAAAKALSNALDQNG